LEDITLRALRVLRSVDRVACEDTRQTAKLLAHFGIQTSMVSYHTHNEAGRSEELIEQLKAGGRIAVVSDAGTPAIADPGATIAAQAIAAGIAVYPIPGANAALSALIASGLPTERFTFHGFLPSKEGARRSTLEALRGAVLQPEDSEDRAATHIFYETPHRILGALGDVAAVFGPEHRIALGRELTKLHEEFLRGTAREVLAALEARPVVRGEMVLVLDGVLSATQDGRQLQSLADEVAELVSRQNLSEKDALKQAAKNRGIGKSDAYREWQRSRSKKR
jgi:16S rRNA (cytidine1402-2'-O)-methyltransferase